MSNIAEILGREVIDSRGNPTVEAEVMLADPDPELKAAVEEFLKDKMEGAIYQPTKMEHANAIAALKNDLFAHLKEMNHGPRFWAHVETLTPHARRARKWLRENGRNLLRYN